MSKGVDFLDAIDKAQELLSTEPASLFAALTPPKKALLPPTKTGALPESQESVDWDYQCDVFLIYRPWHNCPRCGEDIQARKVELPEDGDIVCPHTRRKAYLAVIQKILNEGWLQVKRDEQFLQSGSVQVMVGWLVPRQNKEKAKKLVANSYANTSEE